MGTTDTALESDTGVQLGFVLAIEGYDNLIVSHDKTAALTAWAATEWTTALDGLVIDGAITQKYEPWGSPIEPSRLSFEVKGPGGDQLGADAFNRASDAQTELTADLDETATEVDVLDTEQFGNSGTIYIGTERIDYSGRSREQFFNCVRGKYAPFKADTEASQRFAQVHRIETDDLGVIVPPEVSDKPRDWNGRRIGLWVHKIDGGVWDTRAEARLDFAGRISDVVDTAAGTTVIHAEDIRGDLRNATLGVGRYRAVVAPTVYIDTGVIVTISETSVDSSTRTTVVNVSNSLTFVASSPSTNEALSGYYRAEELAAVLNEWMGDIFDASSTEIRYTLTGDDSQYSLRMELDSGSAHAGIVTVKLRSTGSVWELFGFELANKEGDNETVSASIYASDLVDKTDTIVATSPAWTLNLRPELRINNREVSRDMTVTKRAGTWYNNAATAPEPWRSMMSDVSNWGFARIGKFLGPVERVDATTYRVLFRGDSTGFMVENLSRYTDNIVESNEFGDVTFEQVIAIEGTFTDVLGKIVRSTNGASYNDATHDTYPRQLSAGIPGELVGSRFTESLTHAAASLGTNSVRVVLDKPMSLLDVFGAELTVAQAFFVFEDNELQLSTFSSAIGALAHHTVNVSSRQVPAGQLTENRTPLRITSEYLVNSVKIAHSRESLSSEKYRHLEIRDQPSIDHVGAVRPLTIKFKNLYEGQAITGDLVERFAKEIVHRVFPLFGRPIAQFEFPISFNHFHMVPGDTISITDAHVRDPSTGVRGITAACGTVMSVSHTWPSDGKPWSGKAVAILYDRDRFATYSPAARIDSGASGGGYSAGGPTIELLPNEYSGAIQGSDAEQHFESGDEITIIEVDPDDPAAPQSWNTVVDGTPIGDSMDITDALTGFDANKEYRVIARRYNDTQSEQKVHAFLASRADSLISDSKRAREFSLHATPPRTRARSGGSIGSAWLPASSSDDLLEIVPESTLVEGAPVTPALEAAIARTATALVETITPPGCSFLFDNDVFVPPPNTNQGWLLFGVIPFYVGKGRMTQRPGYRRPLIVAPVIYSGTGGEEGQLRVTSASLPPIAGTDTDYLDVSIPGATSEALTFTTTSTSMDMVASQKLTPLINPKHGYTYLIIEGRHVTSTADTRWRGFHELRIGEPEAL